MYNKLSRRSLIALCSKQNKQLKEKESLPSKKEISNIVENKAPFKDDKSNDFNISLDSSNSLSDILLSSGKQRKENFLDNKKLSAKEYKDLLTKQYNDGIGDLTIELLKPVEKKGKDPKNECYQKKVDKEILCRSSSVIDTMFKNNMKEKETFKLDWKNHSYILVEMVLKKIYLDEPIDFLFLIKDCETYIKINPLGYWDPKSMETLFKSNHGLLFELILFLEQYNFIILQEQLFKYIITFEEIVINNYIYIAKSMDDYKNIKKYSNNFNNLLYIMLLIYYRLHSPPISNIIALTENKSYRKVEQLSRQFLLTVYQKSFNFVAYAGLSNIWYKFKNIFKVFIDIMITQDPTFGNYICRHILE